MREWSRYYEASVLKFNALRSVYVNDGEAMLENVLKNLKLKSAADVVKQCGECCKVTLK